MICLPLRRRDNYQCGLSMTDGITAQKVVIRVTAALTRTDELNSRAKGTHLSSCWVFLFCFYEDWIFDVFVFPVYFCGLVANRWHHSERITDSVYGFIETASWTTTYLNQEESPHRPLTWVDEVRMSLLCCVDGWRCSDNRLMGSLSYLPFSTGMHLDFAICLYDGVIFDTGPGIMQQKGRRI